MKRERKGIEKGISQGRAEGERNMAIQIAKNLLDVLDNEMIAKKTGLTGEEVEDLRKNKGNL